MELLPETGLGKTGDSVKNSYTKIQNVIEH